MPSQAQLTAAQRIRADRQRWRDLVAAVGPDRYELPGAMGEWTFADAAGHLAGWREHRLRELESAARREPQPPPPWPGDLEELEMVDAINDWIHANQAGGTAEERIAAYDATFERLAAAIEALPEPMATDPGAFPWMDGVAAVDGDWVAHLRDEHEPEIRAWIETLSAPGAS